MMEVGGVPVLVRSLQAMQNCAAVDELIVVARTSRLEEIAALRDQYALTKMTKVVVGGMTRAESSLAGVLAASNRATLIGVHDAARPLVTDVIITDTISAAQKSRAAAPGIPVRDTVKVTSDGIITGTPARSTLSAIQTPQVFQADLIKAALTNAMRKHLAITDDCSAVEQLRVKPVVTQGLGGEHQDHDADRHRACRAHPEEARQGMMRIGHGYDVHRLVRGRRLIIGGVDIPHETGLLGHSGCRRAHTRRHGCAARRGRHGRYRSAFPGQGSRICRGG